MPLNEIQESFAHEILRGSGTPDTGFAALFEADRIGFADRLGVYRENVRGGLAALLSRTYPCVEALVGADFFRAMAVRFATENPPTEGCLNLYGQAFPGFIAGYAPARPLPWLCDVARLESAVNESFYAPDDRAFPVAALEGFDFAGNLPLRASARIVDSAYPVKKIHDFCRAAACERAEEEKVLPPDLAGGGESVLVFRPALRVVLRSLSPGERGLFRACEDGRPFAEGVEAALAAQADFDLSAFFREHLAEKCFRTLGVD